MNDHWSTVKKKLKASGITVPDVDDAKLAAYSREGMSKDPVENLAYGYGLDLCDKFDPATKQRWEFKLVVPKDEDITAAQEALTAETVGYEAAVNRIGGPVSRLVAIHLFNALIQNRVSFADAKGLKLKEWGSTSAFATLKSPFSLVPLSYAYGPRTLNESFAVALASLAVDDLSRITHSQVKERFKDLVVHIVNDARPSNS